MDAAAQVARQMWDEIDPANIADSWAQRVPELAQVVTGAQLGVAREADGYVSQALQAQDLADDAVAEVNPTAFAGEASDGRALMTLLTNPAVVTLLTIQDIHDLGRAMGYGRHNLDMLVRTQVADAARAADQVSIVAHPSVDGYIRQTDGNPCARCLLLAGKFYQWNRGFQRHPRCGCTHVPARAGAHVPDAKQMYDRMSRAERVRAGFTRAEMAAIEEGADIYQVVNARRGVYLADGRRFTREGTTRHGFARARLGRGAPRLTPGQILRDATSREHAQELLYRHGYLVQRPQRVAMPSLPSGAVVEAAIPGPLPVRRILAEARRTDVVSQVLADEYQRITGWPIVVDLRGSLETAREHAEGILRAVERNPELVITRISTGPTGRAYAVTSGTEIVFSQRWSSVARRQDYLDSLAADVRSGWHPGGMESPISVAVHEAGHILDPRTLRRDIEDLLDRAAAQTGVARDQVVRLGISGYADRDIAELVAEAYSDVVINGARASGLSRAVVRLVDASPHRGRGGTIVASLPSMPDPSRLPVTRLRAMVQAHGITAPPLISKRALVKLVDDLERGIPPQVARATAARTVTDQRRIVADALVRADELLAGTPSERALQYLGRSLRKGGPGINPDAPEFQALLRQMKPLLDALDAADVRAVAAAIPQVARAAKIRRVAGAPGDVVPFRAAEMEWIGQTRGQAAYVVRPGYATTYDGSTIVLAKAAVHPASPEQAAAVLGRPAAKKAAKKAAAPAKKAPAKKVAAPKAPSAPSRMSIAALKTELERAGVTDIPARVPKPVLVEQVRALRAGAAPDVVAAAIREAVKPDDPRSLLSILKPVRMKTRRQAAIAAAKKELPAVRKRLQNMAPSDPGRRLVEQEIEHLQAIINQKPGPFNYNWSSPSWDLPVGQRGRFIAEPTAEQLRAHIESIMGRATSGWTREEIVEELARQARITPRSMVELRAVGRVNYSRSSSAYAAYDPASREIMFSPKWQDRARLEESLRECVEIGFHPPTGSVIDSVVAHEYGHHVVHRALQASTARRHRIIEAVDAALDLDGWLVRRFRRSPKLPDVIDEFLRSPTAIGRVYRRVSGYAEKNYNEFLAEVWSEYTTGNPPRPHIRRIGDALREAAESVDTVDMVGLT